MKPEFTILMPCLNEEKTIVNCIREAQDYIARNNLSAEILIADNGSVDDSVKLATECGARIVHVSEKGYGNALRGGIAAAEGTYVIMGDCDMSYDFSDLDGFVKYLREGYALVMGNRFGQIEKGAMPFTHRYFGVPFLSWVGRLKFHTKVYDFHCGIRGFEREKALLLNLQTEGMEFATEIIAKFALSDAPIMEIPVKLRPDGREGKSHIRDVRDGLRHLKFIINY